jgi:hypothetical protein
MHYMMDIETHTMIYLRDLLATRAAHDPHITAFLSCWVYEELWHGEAFSDFLRHYGIEVPAEPKLPDGSTPLPSRPTRIRTFREQLGVGHQLSLLPTMLGSFMTRDFIAIHMTWGAINELTTLSGYHQLIRRSGHPILHQMLRKVIQDERRHFAFYRAQGRARLERATPRARRFVGWVFDNFWTPVGAGVKSQEEVDALALYLFGDSPEGRAGIREIDATSRSRSPASRTRRCSRTSSTQHCCGLTQAASSSADRISAIDALSPASRDMCDHGILPPGVTMTVPPSCATSPIGRPCTVPALAPRAIPLRTTSGLNRPVTPARVAPTSL